MSDVIKLRDATGQEVDVAPDKIAAFLDQRIEVAVAAAQGAEAVPEGHVVIKASEHEAGQASGRPR